MVLGKLPVPGRSAIWMIVGQGPIALAVGAGGGSSLHSRTSLPADCIFTALSPGSQLFLKLKDGLKVKV